MQSDVNVMCFGYQTSVEQESFILNLMVTLKQASSKHNQSRARHMHVNHLSF